MSEAKYWGSKVEWLASEILLFLSHPFLFSTYSVAMSSVQPEDTCFVISLKPSRYGTCRRQDALKSKQQWPTCISINSLHRSPLKQRLFITLQPRGHKSRRHCRWFGTTKSNSRSARHGVIDAMPQAPACSSVQWPCSRQKAALGAECTKKVIVRRCQSGSISGAFLWYLAVGRAEWRGGGLSES